LGQKLAGGERVKGENEMNMTEVLYACVKIK
jgi:hypothetical protein